MYDKDGDNLLSLEELKRLLQPDANGAPDLQTEMAAASLLEVRPYLNTSIHHHFPSLI